MQEVLNAKVIEAAQYIAKVMPSYINDVKIDKNDNFIEVLLGNPTQPDKPIWLSTEGGEIMFCFAESHFHITDYSDEALPENLIEEMVVSIIRLISGSDLTYSAWLGERNLGGGFIKSQPTLNDIQNKFKKASMYKVWGWFKDDNQVINT